MRDFLRVAFAAAATAVAMFALLFVVALWAAQHQAAAHRNLARYIASGALNQRAALGPLDKYPTANYAYDCIIFSMIGTARGDLVDRAMSNYWVGTDSAVEDPRAPALMVCQDLLRAFPELAADGWDRVQVRRYDNYILGMRALG